MRSAWACCPRDTPSRALALAFLGAAAPARDRTLDEIRAEVRAAGKDVEGKLLDELAGLRTEESLAAWVEATGAPDPPVRLKPAYEAFRLFRGVAGLEDEAIAYLAGRAAAQANQRGVHAALSLARLAPASANELARLAPSSRPARTSGRRR